MFLPNVNFERARLTVRLVAVLTGIRFLLGMRSNMSLVIASLHKGFLTELKRKCLSFTFDYHLLFSYLARENLDISMESEMVNQI